MGFIIRTEKIEPNIQVSHDWCPKRVGLRFAGSHPPEFLDEALTHWRFKLEFPCSQTYFHQEAFLLTRNWKERKSPGK